MQSSAQEVTMLFKVIAAAKDSWACFKGGEWDTRGEIRAPRGSMDMDIDMMGIKRSVSASRIDIRGFLPSSAPQRQLQLSWLYSHVYTTNHQTTQESLNLT